MRIFITGGTGFIGRNLTAALLARGDQVVVLTRDRSRAADLGDAVEIVEGDPVERGGWMEAVCGCDVAVHLAGAPIAGKRWDARYRQVLVTSRVESAHNLVAAIAACAEGRPAALISASGIDIYPFAEELAELPDWFEDSWVAEDAPKSDSFLGRLCRDWEREANAAAEHGARTVTMRTGLVLGPGGGALPSMVKLFKLCAGGKLGSGAQWTSWIHIDDAIRGFLHAIDDADLAGPVNLVAPESVRNRDFARSLARALSRPSLLGVPGFALRLAMGDLAEYALSGRRVQPKALLDAGFEFQYAGLEPALEELLSR